MSLIKRCYRCSNNNIPTNLIVKEFMFNYLRNLDVDSYLTNTIIKAAKEATDKANQASDVVSELVFGIVRAQDVSTADGSTQADKNTEFRSEIDALPFEDGVLADTFVVATESGRNQREVNRKTIYEYDTVADMVADTTIVSGKVVSTNGYHAKRDGGGSKYTISSTATSYSIPLANGLHAVFNDSFDIRKFGIVDNKDIDQTEVIGRMCRCADAKRIYTIDFLGFSLRVPNNYSHTTWRKNPVVGMYFRKPHHLKNLYISYDKDGKLISGQNAIMFIPDDFFGKGVFKLTNIEFDILVMDYTIVNFEGDGYMNGFLAVWLEETIKKDYWRGLSRAIKSDYSLHFENVYFKSPGTIRNVEIADILFDTVTVRNMTGGYWGLFMNTNAYNLDVDGMHGVYRDDLHTDSGRVGVKSLIHDETELGNYSVFKKLHKVVNSSCYAKTGGLGILYKFHRIGKVKVEDMHFKNVVGNIEFAGHNPEYPENLLEIDNIIIEDSNHIKCSFEAHIKNILIRNIKLVESPIAMPLVCNSIIFRNINEIRSAYLINSRYGSEVANIVYSNVKTNFLNPLVSISSGSADTITISDMEYNGPCIVRASFNKLTLDNLYAKNTTGRFSDFISNAATKEYDVTINNSKIVSNGSYGNLIKQESAAQCNLKLNNTYTSCAYIKAFKSIQLNFSKYNAKYLVNLETIGPNTTKTYDVTVPSFYSSGNYVETVVLGDLKGTTVWGGIISDGLVRIYHRNVSSESISFARKEVSISFGSTISIV